MDGYKIIKKYGFTNKCKKLIYKYYNLPIKRKDLKKGNEICMECNGYKGKFIDYKFVLCNLCGGFGQLDWVENITGIRKRKTSNKNFNIKIDKIYLIVSYYTQIPRFFIDPTLGFSKWCDIHKKKKEEFLKETIID